MKTVTAIALFAAATAVICVNPLPAAAGPATIDARGEIGEGTQVGTPSQILAAARRVADWQLANMNYHVGKAQPSPGLESPRDWQQATFWVGMTELASRDSRYTQNILAVGKAEKWQLGRGPYFADDQLIAQVWDWASRHGAGRTALSPSKAYFDNILAHPSPVDLDFRNKPPGQELPACIDRWCWCDSLFMAPATWLKVGKSLGDPRYADFVHREFRATTDVLYDKQERLYFRDTRFFDRRDAAGRKLFWSRGNGWVLAGLVRILETLDSRDPQRPYYLKLYREMAARIVTLQKPDGYWPASLLDQGDTPPETSGTSFFVYALAWGVRTGKLDGPQYRTSAVRGWNALQRAVQPDGMLGWVQQASDRPDSVSKTETQFFGSGAYLLAGTAMYDLAKAGRAR